MYQNILCMYCSVFQQSLIFFWGFWLPISKFCDFTKRFWIWFSKTSSINYLTELALILDFRVARNPLNNLHSVLDLKLFPHPYMELFPLGGWWLYNTFRRAGSANSYNVYNFASHNTTSIKLSTVQYYNFTIKWIY